MKEIDARGLACPQPVILTRKAMLAGEKQLIVRVDNAAAVENLKRLAEIAKSHSCVKKVQLLPFRTLCAEKYERLGMPFPLAGTPQPDAAKMRRLNQILQTHLK